jgi:hypothetical protein
MTTGQGGEREGRERGGETGGRGGRDKGGGGRETSSMTTGQALESRSMLLSVSFAVRLNSC